MKCKTQFHNQENRYEIYFAYEDYFGGTKFRSYDEMQEQDHPQAEGCRRWRVRDFL